METATPPIGTPTASLGPASSTIHYASTIHHASTRHTSSPSRSRSDALTALAVPEVPEPRKARRWEVWVGFAAATLALELACYFLSGSACGVEEQGLGADIDRPTATREEVFFNLKPFVLVGPWVSVALLACFVDHRGRFNDTNPVHVWTRRFAMVSLANPLLRLLAIPMYCSEDKNFRYIGQAILNVSVLSWTLIQMVLVKVVDLKLQALCQRTAVKVSRYVFAAIMVTSGILPMLFFVVVFGMEALWEHPIAVAFKSFWLLLVFAYLAVAAWGMLRAASGAETSTYVQAGGGGRGADHQESSTTGSHGVASSRATTLSRLHYAIQWTRTTAVMTVASGAMTVVYIGIWLFQSVIDITFLGWLQILDHIMTCTQMGFLSGIVGPDQLRRHAESLEKVGRHSGFALQEAKRIAFNGRVEVGSSRCVVSFPGSYAEMWARVTGLQSRQASVACVFLTDSSTGLGEHARDPANPQYACYCRSIYPPFSADAYLRTVRRPDRGADLQEYRRQLAFEKADAEAMGVHLLVESHYPSWMSGWAQSLAFRKAGQLCDRNDARAPWGCMWFAKWLDNVEKAAELGQELLVFYKEGKAGLGKLPWDQLSDPERVMSASACSGLGASQRVEVAFLERKGYRYTELDVLDFESEFPKHD